MGVTTAAWDAGARIYRVAVAVRTNVFCILCFRTLASREQTV